MQIDIEQWGKVLKSGKVQRERDLQFQMEHCGDYDGRSLRNEITWEFS